MLIVVVLTVLLTLWLYGMISSVGGPMIHSLLAIAFIVWIFDRFRLRPAMV